MAKTQTLSFPIRLPDAMQAEALRLLDASREAINEIIVDLWPQLDQFAGERSGPAWKQVERHLIKRSGHGSRQERCEMESAGRLLRAQASRKQVFQTILPLLSEGLIRPADEKGPARKDHRHSLNIARLGMAFLITYHQTQRYVSYRMTDSSVKPALYIRAGATLLLPSQGFTARPPEGKHIYYAGWSYSIALRTSQPEAILSVLSTSRLRKNMLMHA